MHILIADNQKKVRYALTILLQGQPGWDVIGSTADAQDLLARVNRLKPEILLLDWDLPGQPRGQLIESLRALASRPYIICMSALPEVRQEALSLGVDEFISKVDPPYRLLEAIHQYEVRQSS